MRDVQLEVWVIECLPHGDTLRRIKCEKPLDEMQKLPINMIRRRYDLLDENNSSDKKLAGDELSTNL